MVGGEKGMDPKVFIINIKPKVLKLIKGKNKSNKVKFIFLCKFTKENPATGQIDTNSGNFSNKPIIVYIYLNCMIQLRRNFWNQLKRFRTKVQVGNLMK